MKTPSASYSYLEPVFLVEQRDAFHSAVPIDGLDFSVPDELDLIVLECTVLKDLLRTQLIPSVYDGHFAGKLGQEYTFFDCGVPAADDDKLLLLEEGTVTYGTVADAAAAEGILAVDADLLVFSTRRNDPGCSIPGQLVLLASSPLCIRPRRTSFSPWKRKEI